MRFSFPDSYFDYFSKHGILELEDFLSSQDTDTILEKTQSLLSKNLQGKPLSITSNAELWQAGLDLWKEDPALKKILLQLQLGDAANFLFKKRPIRLAYTQALFTGEKKDPYFSKDEILQNVCCRNPLLGGVVLCLQSFGLEKEEGETKLIPNLLSGKKGNIFFFSANYPLPFPQLFNESNLKLVILGLSSGKIHYHLEPKDPHTHSLKKSGFVFGDALPEEICPYLYR